MNFCTQHEYMSRLERVGATLGQHQRDDAAHMHDLVRVERVIEQAGEKTFGNFEDLCGGDGRG
jgi:hypothetical protein